MIHQIELDAKTAARELEHNCLRLAHDLLRVAEAVKVVSEDVQAGDFPVNPLGAVHGTGSLIDLQCAIVDERLRTLRRLEAVVSGGERRA